jgi:hypothetical protein
MRAGSELHHDLATPLGALQTLAVAGFLSATFACAGGDLKAGLGPNDGIATVLSVTSPVSTIDAGQVVVLRASGRTAGGQTAPVSVTWSASGGSVVPVSDSVAQFSAAAAGTYLVRARGTVSPFPEDSTSITIVAPASPTVSVSVAPGSASLSTGGGLQFSVSATRQDGSTYVPSVSWSANGGTITSSGGYTVGGTVGTFRVIAVQQGGTLADTSTVTVSAPPPPGANPNEPAGMTVGFDEAWNSSPNGRAPGPYWYTESNPENVSIVADATAPTPGGSVLQLKFPAGFGGGNAPLTITWSEFGHFPANTGTLYLRMRVKISSNWSNGGNGIIKFFWPRPNSETTAHYIPLSSGSDVLQFGFNLQASYLGGQDRDYFESATHSKGNWHDLEMVLYQGTSGTANNGTAQIWVDGVQTLNQVGIKYLFDGESPGWKYMSINPTFGGGTNPVPYDEYIWIDHWYASVK